MENKTFKALVVSKNKDGTYSRAIRKRKIDSLPDHDVTVRVEYSSLNYKDALSATGNKGVTQNFPHTPGIDAAGIIAESKDPRFKAGDEVIVTSFDLGQNTSGGFGAYIRVPGDWVVPLPDGLSLRESMSYGTAGFTAAYGMHKLIQNNLTPSDGAVLVTGATGGVGSLAVALLAKQKFRVIAATGKADQKSFLNELGAAEVIDRDDVYPTSRKPLLSGRWMGAIETVGGEMLDAVLRQTNHNGTVACCGNVLGGDLNTSIYPFILRGVSLMGIDSGICLMPMRKKIWQFLAREWKPENLEKLVSECGLEDLETEIEQILNGQQVGRKILRHVHN